jgi:N-acyl-D-aspartate/D-glutamate deacylase
VDIVDQIIASPEAIIVGAAKNPKLLAMQGKNLAEIARLWNKNPIDTIFDLLMEDAAFSEVAVSGMSEPDVSLALQQA